MIKAAYIHIPFCEHICHYCDFNKVFLAGQPVDQYLASLKKEMELTIKKSPTEYVNSIFVGGGTPTALNEKQLETLCGSISEFLPINEETEFTFEANPGDLSIEKLQVLHDSGVNRLSLGVQTFNDELLKRIGRVHQAEDVFRSVERAKKVGFENISVDLIYSLPGQTIEDFRETLNTSFSLDIKHFSGYSLIIEPKTVFYNLMKKGRLPLPGEDMEAAMFGELMEAMAREGYQQYEISNFAKSGYESRHNLTYWNNEEYYGFGAGAHSYVSGRRCSNHGPLRKYMEPLEAGVLPIFEENEPTKIEQMEEELFLGLRKNKGVSLSKFQEKFNEDLLQLFGNEVSALREKGLVEMVSDYLRLTDRGRFLGNEVFQEFLGVV